MMSDDIIRKIYSLVFPALFVLIGVLQVVFPEEAWWIEHGMPKNTEPSDAGILFTKIGGIIFAIVGIIIFFIFLHH